MGLRRAWGCILSIKGFDAREWQLLAERALHLNPLAVELNLSCPNVKEGTGYLAAVQVLKGKIPLIRKLPPLGWQPLIDPDIGTWYHCCNTLPSVRGGVSGKRLKPYSLHLIEILRRMFGSRIQIIGGGGVTTAQDVRDYHHAGADHVSVASLLLNPLAWYKVPLLQEAEGECNGRAGQRAVLG
jgi:dihydroorotate dehydrogenase